MNFRLIGDEVHAEGHYQPVAIIPASNVNASLRGAFSDFLLSYEALQSDLYVARSDLRKVANTVDNIREAIKANSDDPSAMVKSIDEQLFKLILEIDDGY